MRSVANPNPDLRLVTTGGVRHRADDETGFENVPPPLERASFFTILSGRPGTGKTSWLMKVLNGGRNKLYNRKFDIIHWWSPSLATMDVPLPRDRLHDELDMQQMESIMKSIPSGSKALFVIDDFVSQIKQHSRVFLRMVNNRRHLGGSMGGLSILMTTQKMNSIPLAIRHAASSLVLFAPPRKEARLVFDDIGDFDTFGEWQQLLDFVFDRPHSFLFILLTKNKAERYYKRFDRIIFET